MVPEPGGHEGQSRRDVIALSDRLSDARRSKPIVPGSRRITKPPTVPPSTMPKQNVVSVAGAKGGVGKTTTCINLGSALACRGRSVLVVELDLAMANVVDFLDLGFDPAVEPTLHDVLAGEATPTEATYAAPGGFDLLPSGTSLDGYVGAKPGAIADAVRALRGDYDVVLLDTGAGLSYEALLPLGLADWTVVVSTPRVAAVRDAQKTTKLVTRVGGSAMGLVLTKDGTGTAPAPERIANFLELDLLGRVPRDGSVPAAQDAGAPIVTHDIATPAARAYWTVAERVEAKLSTGPRTVAESPRAVSTIDL